MAVSRWLRVGALASSLLLVGGFVSYRVGAFDRFIRPATPYQPTTTEMMGGSKSKEVFSGFEDGPTQSPADDAASPEPAVMMFSTKSSLVISEHDLEPTPPPPTPPPSDRVMQSGSKVMVLDFSPPSPTPTTNANPSSAPNGAPPAISKGNARKGP